MNTKKPMNTYFEDIAAFFILSAHQSGKEFSVLYNIYLFKIDYDDNTYYDKGNTNIYKLKVNKGALYMTLIDHKKKNGNKLSSD